MGSMKEGEIDTASLSFEPSPSSSPPNSPAPSTPCKDTRSRWKIENYKAQSATDSDDESIRSTPTHTSNTTTTTWSVDQCSTPKPHSSSSCCTTPEAAKIQSSLQASTNNNDRPPSESKSPPYIPVIGDSCFQCAHLGLRCSFTSFYQLELPPGIKGRWCSRCLRNGEVFCILQEAVKRDGRWIDEVKYEADGVTTFSVMNKVEQMKNDKAEKFKWALPPLDGWKRKFLRRVYPPLAESEAA